MSTDFRDGKTFPRRGRDAIGEALWLARMADKGRAAAAGTIYDYIYPCPMDRGVMKRWGITPAAFDAALERFSTDDALYAWLIDHVPVANIRSANRWLLEKRVENLNRQDAEERAMAGDRH